MTQWRKLVLKKSSINGNNRITCRYCGVYLNDGYRVCPNCHRHQSFVGQYLGNSTVVVGLAAVIVTLIFWIVQLREAKKESQAAFIAASNAKSALEKAEKANLLANKVWVATSDMGKKIVDIGDAALQASIQAKTTKYEVEETRDEVEQVSVKITAILKNLSDIEKKNKFSNVLVLAQAEASISRLTMLESRISKLRTDLEKTPKTKLKTIMVPDYQRSADLVGMVSFPKEVMSENPEFTRLEKELEEAEREYKNSYTQLQKIDRSP